ncbi:winged helix DNA-binding domain-containing protein [Streptomyces sp. NPDC001502]|uniref:winged helix DNA-binding domain-containing protein n=1 Tax=Streptomyces sp. NPDC001502 TaxID=3364578 RepID=UPI0036D1E86E
MPPIRPKISDEHRRRLLVTRHLLTPATRAATPEQVADAVVALHATDPAGVHLSVAARLATPSVTEAERALYTDRNLVRMLCMRRTMFVVPRALAPAIDASTARTVAARERRNLLKVLTEQLGHDARWLSATEQAVLAALVERGEASAARLADAVPQLRERIVVAPGKPYESRPRLTSRVLSVLAAEGRIRRGRPLGTWASSQFRWTIAEPHPELPVDQARAEVATAYLTAFGPVTTEDLTWWTGWTRTDTRTALARIDTVDVDLTCGPGHALPVHLEAPTTQEPAAVLLPALDPTPMGWRHRDWYLDPAHVPELFDAYGNIGPTLWWNGRIIGGWAQRPDGEIATHLLTDAGIGREARAAIDAETARLTAFFGDICIRPSLRTPLERRLSAQEGVDR